MNAQKPIIFLAFANEKESESRYLRGLAKEQTLIRESLEPALEAGLCELIVESNATVTSILNTFQKARYKDRIAIFHYGGHADGYQLLLETLEGSNQVAHGEGLVSFLARQQSLQLIFLNGCSTQQQSIELTEAGVPAVIGTSHSIADHIATQLAIRFYSSLANGASINRAWKEAEDEVKIVEGTSNTRGFYNLDQEMEAEPDFFPWDMYVKEGAEIIMDWNLPEAVDNPLFGLPDLPPAHLPDRPYRFLQRYQREHAEIFFGRSYYIRDLYDRATDKTAAPVILFYGQSGVGKSSMLDAGLLPRLEQEAQVVYIRRDRIKGLKSTLMDALAQAGSSIGDVDRLRQILDPEERAKIQSKASRLSKIADLARKLDEDDRQELEGVLAKISENLYAKSDVSQDEVEASESGVLDEIETPLQAWKAIEAASGRPLIILLDQVEEVFTQPNPDLPQELEELLAEVKEIFHSPKDMPKGKLILSYRKEYNPEIEELFKKYQIPREGLFLKQLTKKDIMEVITGLTRSDRVKNQYRLSVDSELPSVIADDLLEDRDSPIAPILQILLTKMWNIVEPDEYRSFTLGMYQNLKREGLLMGDFLDQQLEDLRETHEDLVESGLALDFLYFHTTELGTAASKPGEELRERYHHHEADVNELVVRLKQLYLLADAGSDMTALAHDTLAPLVQQRFRNSDLPGQRAARIMENKVVEYKNDPSTTLDRADLAIVEEGVHGTKAWGETEEALIAASRARRRRELRNRRRLRVGAVVAAAVIALFGVVAVIQSQIAQKEKERALEQEKLALIQKERAEAEEQKALAEKARADVKAYEAECAAIEAEAERILAQKAAYEAMLAQIEALRQRDSADAARTRALIAQQAAIDSAVAAKKARTLAEQKRIEAEIKTYLSTAKALASKSEQVEDPELGAKLADQAYRLYTSKLGYVYDDDIYNGMYTALSRVKGDSYNLLPQTRKGRHRDAVRALNFNSQGNYLYSTDSEGKLLVWQWNGDRFEFSRKAQNFAGRAIAVDPSGQLFLGGSGPSATESPRASRKSQTSVGGSLRREEIWDVVYVEKQAGFIATGSNKLLTLYTNDEVKVVDTLDAPVRDLDISPDGNILVGVDDQGNLISWDLRVGFEVAVKMELKPKYSATVTKVAFSPDGKYIAYGDRNGGVYLFDRFTRRTIPREFSGHHGEITGLAFHHEGHQLASASLDRTIRLWNINDATHLPMTFDDHDSWIMSMSYTPDGKYVLAGCRNGEIKRWPTNPGLMEGELCQSLGGKKLKEEEWKLYVGDQIEWTNRIDCD
jgi:hypothetical protein